METLDYAFLNYLGVSVDGEEALHSFYLPFLTGCQRVLDLGCGMGGFVKLLRKQGFDGYGVDSDPQCIAEARRHQLPVVEADIVNYLRALEPATLDAIFSAHVVEHMPYEVVLETIQLAYRALRPGGRLLLVTPNPRALVSHLEQYHMHFGHVAMYHPKLLAFFMDFVGFTQIKQGENPHTMAKSITATDTPIHQFQEIIEQLDAFGTSTDSPAIDSLEAFFPKPKGLYPRILWNLQIRFVNWFVRPIYQQLVLQFKLLELNNQAQLRQKTQQIKHTLELINRPFECYVLGEKS